MTVLFPGSSQFLVPFAVVAVVAFAIVAVVAARRDPDPAGTRPYAIYLSLILFVAVFTALFAATALISNIVRIPLQEYGVAGTAYPGHAIPTALLRRLGPLHGALGSRLDRGHAAGAVQAALVLVAAVLVLWFHVGRIQDLVREPRFENSPGRRTYQVYLHAVSFVAMTILLFAGASALYGIFRVAAPGTTGPQLPATVERGEGIAQLVATTFLALAAYAIFAYHWHRTRTLRGVGPVPPLGRHAVPRAPLPPVAEPEAPPEPAVPVSEEAPPPVAPPT